MWTFLFSLFQEEPRKVCFTYDLFLNLEGNPPVNHLRCEKLTFNNPTTEFRYKLLRAGGVSVPRPCPPRGRPAQPEVSVLGAETRGTGHTAAPDRAGGDLGAPQPVPGRGRCR